MAKNLKLAKKALALYQANPELTVDELAGELGVDRDEAFSVVDEHRVASDGEITHEGPGGGGGWVPQPA